ncbi:hypothetical protein EWM64_g4007 [Hericium alpestre]|uniref:Integrase catalytic domain-containing protein n=1 Tax=Hericium alpestre TaxID=135208 RepID=A0A4Y9ZYN3_9AGAM|nr:hypothetical protein EWM64_g4007 [Hericium alpestre]
MWAFKFTSSGTGKMTVDSLRHIFAGFIMPKVFMSDGGSHFKCKPVQEFCTSWKVKHHIVAAYSPWVNSLVEGTNKILLHVLACLMAPGLGEDEYKVMDEEDIPKQWPDHLDEAICILNNCLLPTLVKTRS